MKTQSQRRSSPRRRKTVVRPWLLLFRSALWLLAAAILWCGYLFWLINGYSEKDSYPQADAGIILGAALWNDQPSPALRERLDFAAKLLENGTVKALILSGGHGGRSSTLTEAEGMRNYLTAKGISEDRLLLETKAASTYQNLLFSQQLGQAEGFRTYIIITHDYHAARAKEMADYAEINAVAAAGVQSTVLNEFYNDSREVLAFTKWKLDWLSLVLGIRSPESLL
ncbi:YdcF family protein [Paenibacillus sp. GCM10027627]|uniref:YdcF family protein n=1 Tax=unclassified Paenibacillus TaxID=185978 RepID=UPI00364314BE